MVAAGAPAGEVAAYTLRFIGDTLVALTANAKARYGDVPVLYAGGVMSNRYLQERLAGGADALFAEPAFSADNAAGVALLCRAQHLRATKI